MNRGPRIERQTPIVATKALTDRIERLERRDLRPARGASSPPMLIQQGSTWVTTNADGWFPVDPGLPGYVPFPVPFATVPIVQLTVEHHAAYAEVITGVTIQGRTTTGFTGIVHGRTPAGLSWAWGSRPALIHWMARG